MRPAVLGCFFKQQTSSKKEQKKAAAKSVTQQPRVNFQECKMSVCDYKTISKVVIKVDIYDNKHKRKVVKSASTLAGIDSLAVELKDQKLTLTGKMDPIEALEKLKKWHPTLLTVETVEDDKKGGDNKKNKDEEHYENWLEENQPSQYTNNPHVITPQYCVHEENPNGCVIC